MNIAIQWNSDNTKRNKHLYSGTPVNRAFVRVLHAKEYRFLKLICFALNDTFNYHRMTVIMKF